MEYQCFFGFRINAQKIGIGYGWNVHFYGNMTQFQPCLKVRTMVWMLWFFLATFTKYLIALLETHFLFSIDVTELYVNLYYFRII